jgi:hypothetical protein
MLRALVENDHHCARQRSLLATTLEQVADSKSNFVLNSHFETMLSYGTNIEAMNKAGERFQCWNSKNEENQNNRKHNH